MTELDVILKKIRARLNDIADDLAGGAAQDYAEYRHLVGIVHGLALIERDILDYRKSVEQED